MAEIDVFEARFAAACRRYLDEAPTEVDAVEVARTVVALPRARRLPWTGTFRTVPAPAWVLLIAALLTAMIAGTLAVGAQLQRRAPAVVPPIVPAFDCPAGSAPDQPGPVDQARPPAGYATPMTFDRRAGKLIVLVAPGPAVATWTFDVCTNAWTEMHPNREPPKSISRLVYDARSDTTIGVNYVDRREDPVMQNVWAYDLEANAWTEKGKARTGEAAFYDPVSGLVVAGGAVHELWNYDVEADSWTPIRQSIPREPLDTSRYAYDASTDRIVAYAGSETWLLDLRTGAWSQSGAVTPDLGMGFWGPPAPMVYDEAAKRTVVGAISQWGVYDATADQWEILFDTGDGAAPPAVYDPTNRRLVIFGGGVGVSGDMVAFDLVTREWTVLLEASEGQTVP